MCCALEKPALFTSDFLSTGLRARARAIVCKMLSCIYIILMADTQRVQYYFTENGDKLYNL